jgi:lysyl-tRNA synthetase class 2
MSEWRPSASLDQLRMRAATLARIRTFMAERATTEVSTPVITSAGVTEPQIESLSLAQPGGYLRTSPEYYHKRLLSAGLGDLYEIGPVFRAAEHGRLHRQEFTLLEWYRVGWGWRQLAGEVVDLIDACLPTTDGARPIRWISWSDCFEEALGLDAPGADAASLAERADDAPAGLDRNALLDWLFATRIQPCFPASGVTVVYDYPAEQAALARLRADDARFAERFEVFVGPLELANGYHELCDADEQRSRFERDNRARAARGQPVMPVDEAILAALDAGLPDCSGVALGLDRLVMAALGRSSIDEVVSFVHPRSD